MSTRNRFRFLKSFALVAVVSTASYAAQTRALVVVVATDDADRERALALTGVLTAQLRDDERLDLVSLDALAEPVPAGQRKKETLRARELLRQAELARKTGDDKASRLYARALEAFELGDWREASDAQFVALAWSAVDPMDDAALLRLFTARPEFVFPPLTPDLDAFIAEQRKAKAAAVQVEVLVTSAIPALVWLDGVAQGSTPLRLRAVAGRHRVTAMAVGRPLIQHEELLDVGAHVQLSFADTAAGQAVRVELEAMRGGFRSGEYLSPIPGLLRATTLPEVVVVSLKGTEARIVRMNQEFKASTVTVGLKSSNESEVLTMLIRRLYDEPIGVTLTASGQLSWGPSRRTWSYLNFGVGSVLTIVGAVLLGIAGGQLQAAQQIPQTNQFAFDRAVAEARGAQGFGIGGLVLGAVGLGIGGWLFFTSDAPPSQPTVRDDVQY